MKAYRELENKYLVAKNMVNRLTVRVGELTQQNRDLVAQQLKDTSRADYDDCVVKLLVLQEDYEDVVKDKRMLRIDNEGLVEIIEDLLEELNKHTDYVPESHVVRAMNKYKSDRE